MIATKTAAKGVTAIVIEMIKDILYTVGCWAGVMLLAIAVGKFAGLFCRHKDIR